MGTGRSIVITAYGHDKIIDTIAVSSFDSSDYPYGHNYKSNAETYCNTLNSLKLKGESWVFAKIVSENTQHSLESFLPLKFDVILKLDDKVIQGLLRDVDFQDIAIALKGEKEDVQERIIRNMSERAVKMLKEEMEYTGPVRINDVMESQRKIIDKIRQWEEAGVIVINSEGETIE